MLTSAGIAPLRSVSERPVAVSASIRRSAASSASSNPYHSYAKKMCPLISPANGAGAAVIAAFIGA